MPPLVAGLAEKRLGPLVGVFAEERLGRPVMVLCPQGAAPFAVDPSHVVEQRESGNSDVTPAQEVVGDPRAALAASLAGEGRVRSSGSREYPKQPPDIAVALARTGAESGSHLELARLDQLGGEIRTDAWNHGHVRGHGSERLVRGDRRHGLGTAG